MADLLSLNNIINSIENVIEEKFGSQSGYQQVKSAMEGNVEKVDRKEIITDSRAMFSGENKPEVLMGKSIDNLKTVVDNNSMINKNDIDQKRKIIDSQLERNKAVLENRASSIKHEVKPEEALVSGRLVMDDGITPVEGVNVVVHGTGDKYGQIIAKSVTDINGEYVIRLDRDTVNNVVDKISIAFDTISGEKISHSGEINLLKGRNTVVNSGVFSDKNSIAAPLTKTIEERKNAATYELAELKKKEASLIQQDFLANKSVESAKAQLDEIKTLFERK